MEIRLTYMRATVEMDVTVRKSSELRNRGMTGPCEIICERIGVKGTWYIISLDSEELGFRPLGPIKARKKVFDKEEWDRIEGLLQKVFKHHYGKLQYKIIDSTDGRT